MLGESVTYQPLDKGLASWSCHVWADHIMDLPHEVDMSRSRQTVYYIIVCDVSESLHDTCEWHPHAPLQQETLQGVGACPHL